MECSGDDVDIIGLTTCESKRMAVKLFTLLFFSHKYDHALCKIGAQATFAPTHLDLSLPEASLIKKLIQEIAAQYAIDFPPEVVPPLIPVEIERPLQEPEAEGPQVSVQLDQAKLTADQYVAELEKHNQAVASHNKRQLDTYITLNATIVVDDGADIERRKRKLANLPVSQEKKRKLFVKDLLISQGMDWERLKTDRKSMFSPMMPVITEETFDPVLEVYKKLKCDAADDRKSFDTLVCVVPGPPPNSFDNKHVGNMVKVMKRGMGIAPKVGRIEYPEADLLNRHRGRTSFSSAHESYLVFSSELKQLIPRKIMKFLGGDSMFNKWRVPLIPLANLLKTDEAMHKLIFAGTEDIAMAEPADEAEGCEADDLADNQCVPFPQDATTTPTATMTTTRRKFA